MKSTHFVFAVWLSAIVSPLIAQPILTVAPGGIQSGNWVWNVSVTPDLVLAGGDSPLAIELGFRLTGDPLVSVTNVNPSEWDTTIPGNTIFGWETPYSESFNKLEGVEVKCTGCTVTNSTTFGGIHTTTIVPGATNEIFAALGSVDFNTPGAKAILQIVAQGPGSGGPTSSTIQWLGAYAVAKGRIAQIVGGGFNSQNFDLYSGTATQAVPEPASGGLLLVCILTFGISRARRRR